jgi:hypothetical protein
MLDTVPTKATESILEYNQLVTQAKHTWESPKDDKTKRDAPGYCNSNLEATLEKTS